MLWTGDYLVPHDQLRSLGKILVGQTETQMSVDDFDEVIENAYRDRLY